MARSTSELIPKSSVTMIFRDRLGIEHFPPFKIARRPTSIFAFSFYTRPEKRQRSPALVLSGGASPVKSWCSSIYCRARIPIFHLS
jgi:hypothetical protein